MNQIGCHINMAVFLVKSVFSEETLMFSLRKRGFRIVHGPNVVYVPLDLAAM